MLKQIAAENKPSHRTACLPSSCTCLPTHARPMSLYDHRSARRDHFGIVGRRSSLASHPARSVGGTSERDRLCVRWPAAGKRVAFFTGHMLNPYLAPAIVRFLEELVTTGGRPSAPLVGSRPKAFHFSRVQAGRIVLRPRAVATAERASGDRFQEAYHCSLQSWRTEWNVPKRVGLSFADNRLVFDLTIRRRPQNSERSSSDCRLAATSSFRKFCRPSTKRGWRGPRDTTVATLLFRSSYLETCPLPTPVMLVVRYP